MDLHGRGNRIDIVGGLGVVRNENQWWVEGQFCEEMEGENAERDIWNLGVGSVETQCIRNSLESIKVTLVRIPSNEEKV